MKINSILLAASVSIIALSSSAFASQESGDQAMADCRASAASEEIPATELSSYLRQCLASAGLSQDEINMRTGGQSDSDENAAPAAESSD